MRKVASFAILSIVVVLVLTRPAFSEAGDPTETSSSATASLYDSYFTEYKIGPGNVLRVDLYNGRGEKVSERVQVSSGGYISLPFVGELSAIGQTIPQLQGKIKELLSKNDMTASQVSLFIEEYSTVTIMGEVKDSGAYPIKGRLSIVELIALAGGLNESASPNEVKILHTAANGNRTKTVARLYDVINNGGMENESYLLHPGDVVIVPKSTVTIIGEVVRPGAYPTRGRLSVVELIALAEGFTKFAARNDVKVIQTGPDDVRKKSVVHVQDIMSKGLGEDEDILLHSGDVVIVP